MVASHLSSQSNPRLLTLMRSKLRPGHYSRRTEQAYAGRVIRFVRHHRLRHPAELGEQDVMAFLRHLAEERRVAAATQGQALAGLLFLYRHVLGRPLRLEGHLPRARTPTRLPVVLTRSEVARVLGQLEGGYRLVGMLLYGSGCACVRWWWRCAGRGWGSEPVVTRCGAASSPISWSPAMTSGPCRSCWGTGT